MPLYNFHCPDGHETEQLAPMSVATVTCRCGHQAKRSAVYPHASPRKFGSEFHMPADVRSAIDETMGYKAEARTAMQEAVGNGWKPRN